MNLREIEEGGLRFYEAKGRAAGEQDDWHPSDDEDLAYVEWMDSQEPPEYEPPPEEDDDE